jgi:hypothetical protein
MDINPVDETLYTSQQQEVFQKYVENEYHAKHRGLPVIEHKRIPSNTDFSSATAAISGQSSYDANDLVSNDIEDLKAKGVRKPRPGQIDCSACLLNAT